MELINEDKMGVPKDELQAVMLIAWAALTAIVLGFAGLIVGCFQG